MQTEGSAASCGNVGLDAAVFEGIIARARAAGTQEQCLHALSPLIQMDAVPIVQQPHESWGSVVDQAQVHAG